MTLISWRGPNCCRLCRRRGVTNVRHEPTCPRRSWHAALRATPEPPDLSAAWHETLEAIDFPKTDPRWKHGPWMLRLVGPWDIQYNGHRPTYQAWADPYNATGDGWDKSVEGLGPTPAAALQALRSLLAQHPETGEPR